MDKNEEARLTSKGRREPLRGLIEQIEYSTTLFEENRDDLLAYGAVEEMFVELGAGKATLDGFMSSRTMAQSEMLAATSREHQAVSDSKLHLRRLKLTLPMAARRAEVAAADAQKILPAGTLGRSTGRILEHYKSTRGLVEKLDEALKPYFQGKSALTAHDAILKELETAGGAQEVKATGLSLETKDIHLAKGRLLELIEDFNRIGRLANLDNAEKAARYNKDILLRARRGGGKKDEGSQTDGSNKSAAAGGTK